MRVLAEAYRVCACILNVCSLGCVIGSHIPDCICQCNCLAFACLQFFGLFECAENYCRFFKSALGVRSRVIKFNDFFTRDGSRIGNGYGCHDIAVFGLHVVKLLFE